MVSSLSWYGHLSERAALQVLVHTVLLQYRNPCLVIFLHRKRGGGWLLHFSKSAKSIKILKELLLVILTILQKMTFSHIPDFPPPQ